MTEDDSTVRAKPRKLPTPLSGISALDLAIESQNMQSELQDLLLALVPLLDCIEKVSQANTRMQTTEEQVEGMNMIADIASNLMSRMELERVGAIGDAADPLRFEIVSTEAGENSSRGTVLQVIQNGWSFRGTTIRPAKVVVSLGS